MLIKVETLFIKLLQIHLVKVLRYFQYFSGANGDISKTVATAAFGYRLHCNSKAKNPSCGGGDQMKGCNRSTR